MRVLENINIDLKSHNIPNVDIVSSFKLHYTILAPQLGCIGQVCNLFNFSLFVRFHPKLFTDMNFFRIQ